MSSFRILLLLALSVTLGESVNSFHKGKSTEKPDVLYEGSPVYKPRKPPTHISEFTDPDTGLNPFLDLEEGPTSGGRDVMKDERRVDPQVFDFELVEGEAPERRWGLDVPKQPPLEEPIRIWPTLEKNVKEEQPVTTIQYISKIPVTTTEAYAKMSLQETRLTEKLNEEQKVKKEMKNSTIFNTAIIYVSATLITVVVLASVVGGCWWRRKRKRTSQPSVTVENGELKS